MPRFKITGYVELDQSEIDEGRPDGLAMGYPAGSPESALDEAILNLEDLEVEEAD